MLQEIKYGIQAHSQVDAQKPGLQHHGKCSKISNTFLSVQISEL